MLCSTLGGGAWPVVQFAQVKLVSVILRSAANHNYVGCSDLYTFKIYAFIN